MKYTPGPWILIKTAEKDTLIVQAGDFLDSDSFSNTFKSANAYLIAASPELLESLENLVEEIVMSGCDEYMNEASAHANDFNEKIESARKAIAKARGKL